MQTRMVKLLAGAAVALSALALSLCGAALPQRFVVVNGLLLPPGHISMLDQWHCGPVPDGYYWLDFNTGIWGFAGDPTPRGNIADNCRRQSRPSMSEHGLLLGPQDYCPECGVPNQ